MTPPLIVPISSPNRVMVPGIDCAGPGCEGATVQLTARCEPMMAPSPLDTSQRSAPVFTLLRQHGRERGKRQRRCSESGEQISHVDIHSS